MGKVIVHVEGGIVQAIYGTDYVDVRVYDLDMPSFATSEEDASNNELRKLMQEDIEGLDILW